MNIFIHYLDKELLDMYTTSYYSEKIIEKVILSIKVALLLIENDEYIYVPASNYFESQLAKDVLDAFGDIIDLNFVKLISSSNSLNEFIEKKKIVYPSLYSAEQIEEENNKIIEKNVPGIWTQRSNSATNDIIIDWKKNIDSSRWSSLYKESNYRKISTFEKDMENIPKKLKNKAFVVEHVYPELNLNPARERESKGIINREISRSYISSFLKEYDAVCFSNFFLMPQADIILPRGYEHINYEMLIRKLAGTPYEGKSLYSYINDCDNYSLMLLREKCVLKDAQDIKKLKKKEEKRMETFIVHGHDEIAKLGLKNYIQNTLGIGEPIILSEKASGGMTIFEKFEKYSTDCNLVFVLLTPDDSGTSEEKKRARQNVIFELGYFYGKLGRKSGRVLLLHKGNLELPNDLSGIVYINIDNGIEAAGEDIRREIKDLI